MTVEIKIAPKNSLLLVMDKDSGEIPELMNGKLVVATPSCVAVGTLSEADGKTSVMLTDEKIHVHEISGLQKVFTGVLATPKKEVHLYTVLLQSVLNLSVPNTESNVEVWASDEKEPERLCVLVTSTPIDDDEFRPITFQGEIFPATLMGISILEPVLDVIDDELGDWLWKLSNCRGVTKRAAAEQCARCARLAVDLLLEHRQRVLDGIRDRLQPHDFEPETTCRDWLLALQRIAELSDVAEGECIWSAPSHARDVDQAKLKSFIRRLGGN